MMIEHQDEDFASLARIVGKGGPRPSDDPDLTKLLGRVWSRWQAGQLCLEDIARFRHLIPMSLESTQGFAYLKPNGYAGCFETIDRVYLYHTSIVSGLSSWDRYLHVQPGTQALRNRNDYFRQWLVSRVQHTKGWRLLNLGCGPCRDVSEFFAATHLDHGCVRCVDQDKRALVYAAELCQSCRTQVKFELANVLRYQTSERYELVWSAGLFDYLPNSLFVRLLSRIRGWLTPGGEVVIGNFAPSNPTIPYMEVVLDWHIYHRTKEQLCALAVAAGFSATELVVDCEPLGINLFLHART
uniref:Methyltransferase domain-containing protein n=1 Tax=Candidatus Kentrum sp. TUN TaxID=2126343 RepID=A0A450ZPQ2_9GAMM|nr:MAG: Methyltransferase domain-containing protein [Candidatus Kentron sp. TUN]VFK55726.1 MAG: Methyltransferase domain-containing protein [Candidatus Kentron sp. TUN]